MPIFVNAETKIYFSSEEINIAPGKTKTVDVIVDSRGYIAKIMLYDKKSRGRFFSSNKEEVYIEWKNIVKLGDDIILVDVMK